MPPQMYLQRLFQDQEQLTERDQIMLEAGFQQARANKPEMVSVDARAFHCPICQRFGVNTMLGYIRYICGAETTGDEITSECQNPLGVI